MEQKAEQAVRSQVNLRILFSAPWPEAEAGTFLLYIHRHIPNLLYSREKLAAQVVCCAINE